MILLLTNQPHEGVVFLLYHTRERKRRIMRYHNITKDDMLNGDGLRVVLWVAGCPHRCEECQNPVTWDIEGGLLFDDKAKDEIFNELDKGYTNGITLSGGDPLHPRNREGISMLVEEIKQKYPTKTIWLYTGYLWEKIKDLPFIHNIDVIVDGKYDKNKRDVKLMWKGSSNQRVIDVAATLQQDGPIVLKYK